MLFEHAMLQDYAHLFPVAGTESLEYRTFECILVHVCAPRLEEALWLRTFKSFQTLVVSAHNFATIYWVPVGCRPNPVCVCADVIHCTPWCDTVSTQWGRRFPVFIIEPVEHPAFFFLTIAFPRSVRNDVITSWQNYSGLRSINVVQCDNRKNTCLKQRCCTVLWRPAKFVPNVRPVGVQRQLVVNANRQTV